MDTVSAEIQANDSRQLDEAREAMAHQEAISADEIKTLLRKVEAAQTQETSDVLERVVADGGIEAHAMKGDPSKCPFLMGKLGVGQHVEIGGVPTIQEGRSVKEIREERRRMRAQLGEARPEPTPAASLAEGRVLEAARNVFEPKTDRALLEMQTVSTPVEQESSGKVTLALELSVSKPLDVQEEVATKGSKNKDYGLQGGSTSHELKLPPVRHIDEKLVDALAPAMTIHVEPSNEASSIERTLPTEQDFLELSDRAQPQVNAPQHTEELVSDITTETASNVAPRKDSPVEVISVDSNMLPESEISARSINEILGPDEQRPKEETTVLQDVLLPYVESIPHETQVIMDAVSKLNETIVEIMGRGHDQATVMEEITPIVEHLVRELPEEMRAEFLTIIEVKVSELILAVDEVIDQRESFNLLGTHEFKFFHHKPQSQLPIKEKASRYLLALLSKRYAPA